MIKRLQIRNYRNHIETDLNLEPLTVFIGPIASGKSNVFKALLLLHSTLHRRLEELFPPGVGEFRWVRSRWAKTTEAIAFTVEIEDIEGFPGQRARYELEIAEAPLGVFVARERLERYGGEFGDTPGQLVFERDMRGGELGEFGVFEANASTVLFRVLRIQERGVADLEETVNFARAVAKSLSVYGFYHLEVSQLSKPSDLEDSKKIGYRGERMPAFLSYLRDNAEYNYQKIVDEIKQLLPKLKDIFLTWTSKELLGMSLKFSGQTGLISASDVSDGTLLTLGLLCIIHQPEPLNILSIEEPENGLNPGRLKWLFERLVNLAYPPAKIQPVQVLVSTHSPYILDFFKDKPETVHIVEVEDGKAKVISLADILRELPEDEQSRGVSLGHQWYMGLFGGL